MQNKNMTILKVILKQFVFYVLLIIIWQGIFYIGTSIMKWWKPYAFPNPKGVWDSLINMFERNILFQSIFASLQMAFFGFVISIVIGLLLGFLISKFSFLAETVKPLILGIQTLPSICWVPFAILWFGLGRQSILFVIIMGSSFSIAVSVDSAIRNVNPLYIRAAKTMGAAEMTLYLKVIFPASLPNLVAGAKQGWSFAWRSLMAGEVMSASTISLGQALTLGRDLADINRVMLIMILITLTGVIIDKLVFSMIENKVLRRMGY